MKKTLLFLICCLSLLACQQNKTVNSSQKELIKKNIKTVLDDWHLAAANANFEAYFESLDSSAVYIGTDVTEVWTKEQFSKFSKPYFDRGSAWAFKAVERNIYTNNDATVVWFDEILDTWMGFCRGSGVLEQVAGEWKIKQYVLSMTVPNDGTNEIIKVKKKKEKY
ncbi:hypothetical protein GCM10011416_10060 [Polaribacter pacificus]|uniref:SnoaL-like domain-containing protein n=1 Tax=Polaribacter pacificus TaxID=1775173 RepID=A0A917HWV9_9FLAO|nr:nuclear transport factor 2 family protein [Polaribacter pacificus]GGG94651.1 hypothetical protein GCM10011416_10060 [Polaribacter pacificus]